MRWYWEKLFSVIWVYLFHGRLNWTESPSFYHSMSPNCLGRQMLTARVLSQHLVSSSNTIKPDIPWSARCVGYCEMMSAICSVMKAWVADILLKCSINRLTCLEKTVLFEQFFHFLLTLAEKKDFQPVKSPYFCVGQQKKKKSLFWDL